MPIRSSLAPLVLVISIIILLLFAFYYLNTSVNENVEVMGYLSQDYVAYQKSLYYLFVYIPFEIRYYTINYILSNLFSNGNTYNINNIINANYYSSCEIPFVEEEINNKYYPCIPLLSVENCKSDIVFGNIYSDVQNSLNYIEDPYLSFSGFNNLYPFNCEYQLTNVMYNFSVKLKYNRTIYFGDIDYPFYPYILYYNYIISYLYNQTYNFFNYVIENQNNFSSYSNYIYYNVTEGDNVYLYFSFNNTAYYILDLYYNNTLPPGNPGITNITIDLPCESFGQLYNGNCIVNSTLENYEYECLYSNNINYNNLFNGYQYQIVSQETVFNGYWYNVSNINYSYNISSLLPDGLNCTDTVNLAQEMIGNYTYFTGGNYPVLVPVNITVEYNNISCTISNEEFKFGPYNNNDCQNALSNVENIINSNNLNCDISQCEGNNNKYYFYVNCTSIQTHTINSFEYQYSIYEWFNINDKNINYFCSNLQ